MMKPKCMLCGKMAYVIYIKRLGMWDKIPDLFYCPKDKKFFVLKEADLTADIGGR